jgi:hypothetical protein
MTRPRLRRGPAARLVAAAILFGAVAHQAPEMAIADVVEGTDVVAVRSDGVLGGDVVRAVAKAARANKTQAAVIHAMVLQQTGVKRGAEYERYGAILPVGVETWPETYGKLAGIDQVLVANQAAVAQSAADLWKVKQGDVLVIVGWAGGIVEVPIGVVVADAKLQNSEIVLWDRFAKTKRWTYQDRVVVWGARADLEKTMAAARMPIGAKPDAAFSRARVEASWGERDPNTPEKPLELKKRVGEFKYVQNGRHRITADEAWTKTLEAVSAGGVKTQCARGIGKEVQAAFARMQSAGLTPVVNVKATQKYGGCHQAREKAADFYLRTPRPSVRAWGSAYELRLQLVGKGCDVVRAWRAAGWAWVSTGSTSLVFQFTGRQNGKFPSPRCA